MISVESEERPWGRFFVLHDEPTYKLKRIEVDPGGRLSYQYHFKRSEVWVIVEGRGELKLNGNKTYIEAGNVVKVPVEVKHQIRNTGTTDLLFIEVQLGSYFGEDDIVRLEDNYGRV